MTYAEAGVDIEAGDALVDRIKPLARSTDRAGTMGGLGGFGALFDLKAAGFTDPVLVSSTDGVGTKLRLAIDAGHHAQVGIDLVAMCVNDLIVAGGEPLFFLDYYATGKLTIEEAAAVVESIAEGACSAAAAAAAAAQICSISHRARKIWRAVDIVCRNGEQLRHRGGGRGRRVHRGGCVPFVLLCLRVAPPQLPLRRRLLCRGTRVRTAAVGAQ